MVAQRKLIYISTVIGEDRKLVIELPPDTPTGEAEIQVSVQPTPKQDEPIVNPARERLRAKMLAAGMLGTAHYPPEDMELPTEEEILEAGVLPPGARPSEEILREIRDEED